VNYYAGTGQIAKLDEFVDKNILPHTDAVRIYNSYVLNTMATEYPRYFPRYMKKLLLAFPNEMDLAQLAVYYGYNNDLMPQVQSTLDSLMAENKLGYNLQDLNGYHDMCVFSCKINYLYKYLKLFYDKFYNGEQYNHIHGNEFEFLDVFNDTDCSGSILLITNEALATKSFNTVEELEKLGGTYGI